MTSVDVICFRPTTGQGVIQELGSGGVSAIVRGVECICERSEQKKFSTPPSGGGVFVTKQGCFSTSVDGLLSTQSL